MVIRAKKQAVGTAFFGSTDRRATRSRSHAPTVTRSVLDEFANAKQWVQKRTDYQNPTSKYLRGLFDFGIKVLALQERGPRPKQKIWLYWEERKCVWFFCGICLIYGKICFMNSTIFCPNWAGLNSFCKPPFWGFRHHTFGWSWREI